MVPLSVIRCATFKLQDLARVDSCNSTTISITVVLRKEGKMMQLIGVGLLYCTLFFLSTDCGWHFHNTEK